MDDNAINEYIQKLPPSVQDLISDNVWESRTSEIAKKYALNPEQTESLINITFLVLVGIEKPDTFLNTIVTDLGISQLLAEQIMGDLENRVFEYALNTVESKKPIQQTPVVQTGGPKVESKIPEIKPVNLPMFPKNEPSKTLGEQNISVPKYVPTYKPVSNVPENLPTQVDLSKTSPTKTNTNIDYWKKTPPTTAPANTTETSRITYASKNSVEETVQRPVAVPRFTGAPMTDDSYPLPTSSGSPAMDSSGSPQASPDATRETQKPVLNSANSPKTQPPQNIIDSKLNNTVVGATAKPPQAPPANKYNVDPYREPLE